MATRLKRKRKSRRTTPSAQRAKFAACAKHCKGSHNFRHCMATCLRQ